MKKVATLLVVFATLALPVVALAQGSGGDAYTEDIPGPGGNPPSNEGGNGDSPPGDTQSDVAVQGDDGAAAATANLAQSTDPVGTGSDTSTPGAGQPDDASKVGQADNTSNASGNSGSDGSGSGSGSDSGFGEAVVELVGGSDDGMGLLLPIILGSALVAAVGFVIARRSGGSTGSA